MYLVGVAATASITSQQTAPIPLLSIFSNMILAHADDILPDLLLLLPHLFEKRSNERG